MQRLFNGFPFNKLDNLEFEVLDASDIFYENMAGVTDPEAKRKVIGGTFIDVFGKHAQKIGAKWLIQGTIAPDWIESGGGLRDVIKSHHNVGALPLGHYFADREGKQRIYEPQLNLYKDEIRQLMNHHNIKLETIQPFPGPGLAIRTLGEANRERTTITRKACVIVEKELEAAAKAGEMELPWQYFAVLLPTKSVGVQGDVRAYGETIAIRAVGSLDGMTANYAHIPNNVLDKISRRITNTMKGKINRVVYDITDKPPGTIEWE